VAAGRPPAGRCCDGGEVGRDLPRVDWPAALLADRWGTRPLRDGNTVWCALHVARCASGAQPNVNA
jgi:hypothetical protein